MTIPGAGPAPEQTSDIAARLRGVGPLGALAILLILVGSLAGPIVGAVLVLAWARLSHTPLRALGFRPPRSWTVTLLGGAAFGIALEFGLKAIVMRLFGAPPINMPYHYLTANADALPGMIATVLISAGLGEEVCFRGYLFERLGTLLGRGKAALAVTVLISAALFAMAHYRTQGVPGVELAAVTGLVFGGMFAWQKQIWIVMVAHAAVDLTAVALIHWNLEGAVAHLLFR